jgi:translation elongation factor EF-G
MKGRTVCLAHGGRTPRGVASPNFKTGRYSRSLPGHLVADYERATHDPTLLSLRDEIALTDAMIGETLSQLTDDMPWAKQVKAFERIRRLSEQRRKLVESEVRHIVLAREVMTTDEAMALVHAVVAIVTRYLPDPKDQTAIAEELHALIATSGPEMPLGAHRYA